MPYVFPGLSASFGFPNKVLEMKKFFHIIKNLIWKISHEMKEIVRFQILRLKNVKCLPMYAIYLLLLFNFPKNINIEYLLRC